MTIMTNSTEDNFASLNESAFFASQVVIINEFVTNFELSNDYNSTYEIMVTDLNAISGSVTADQAATAQSFIDVLNDVNEYPGISGAAVWTIFEPRTLSVIGMVASEVGMVGAAAVGLSAVAFVGFIAASAAVEINC